MRVASYDSIKMDKIKHVRALWEPYSCRAFLMQGSEVTRCQGNPSVPAPIPAVPTLQTDVTARCMRSRKTHVMNDMTAALRPNADTDAHGSVSVTATFPSTRCVNCVLSAGSTFPPRKSTTGSLLLKAAHMMSQISSPFVKAATQEFMRSVGIAGIITPPGRAVKISTANAADNGRGPSRANSRKFLRE